jgi:DUF4097 and DUF4098 domain-containing protein YvlB
MKALGPLLAPAFLVLTQGVLAQSDSPITRDGTDWVQTSTGSIPICQRCRVRINTEGNFTIHGQAETDTIRFTLRKRVRASSKQEAGLLLHSFDIRSIGRGDLVTLTLEIPRSRAQGAELSMSVPRTLRQTIVASHGGDISATDLKGEFDAETVAGRVELDRLGSNAAIRTGGGEIRLGRIVGAIRCYSGGGGIQAESCGRESWFETAGGDIQVHEALGALHATTAGGNIHVDRSAGEVFAHTNGGVIEVREALGLVTAETSGGAIQVGAARGVRCESNSGAIRLHNLGAGPLNASTAMGSILAELLSGTRIEDSVLSTNAGDITVLLSSNIPITVQASNQTAGNGRRIVSDFPEIRIRNAGATIPLIAEGALNGGGPVLRIFASGGTIYLRRQK